jgi:hypothetical protein
VRLSGAIPQPRKACFESGSEAVCYRTPDD